MFLKILVISDRLLASAVWTADAREVEKAKLFNKLCENVEARHPVSSTAYIGLSQRTTAYLLIDFWHEEN